MWRQAIASASVLMLLAACQTAPGPASVAGECKIFRDPGFRVLGATPDDQRWITLTQETGIRACGWPRPAKRQPRIMAEPEPPSAVAVDAPTVKPWYRHYLGM